MSFGCKYNTAENYCRRLDGECRPGKPGCVLFGRVAFAADVEKQEPKEKISPPGEAAGTAQGPWGSYE